MHQCARRLGLRARLGRSTHAVLPLTIVALTTACSTFDGLTLASHEAGAASGSRGEPCILAQPEQPPQIHSDPSEHDFVVVFRKLDFGTPGGDGGSPDPQNIGFDLDG